MHFQAMGIRGDTEFDDILTHFQSLGGDAILMNPDMVCGEGHLLSAAMHGDRAFAEGTNRSNSLLTEIILYAAWERQIGKAIAKMKPMDDRHEYAAILVDIDDPELDSIGVVRDDSILDATPEKAEMLGLESTMVPFEDQAIEMVALLELQKM